MSGCNKICSNFEYFADIGIAILTHKLMSIYGRMFVYQKGKARKREGSAPKWRTEGLR